MTSWNEVSNDPRFVKVLDHGFVGLLDKMGDDKAIVDAARLSYAKGTKTVNQDRGLIRYLMRHKHTSPFEMAELKFSLKLPIFVMRQLVRHRTSSLNEMSLRYSVMTDEFYVPAIDQINTQSKVNNQGRGELVSDSNAVAVKNLIANANEHNYLVYSTLLGMSDEEMKELSPDMATREDLGLDEDFDGIARELARSILPVSGYTELVWKQNLHNLFHMLHLRMDSHAQYEIREYANAIYSLVKPHFPMATEAFEDYIVNASTISGPEKTLLAQVISISNEQRVSFAAAYETIAILHGDEKSFLEQYNMSKRELTEFKNLWQL